MSQSPDGTSELGALVQHGEEILAASEQLREEAVTVLSAMKGHLASLSAAEIRSAAPESTVHSASFTTVRLLHIFGIDSATYLALGKQGEES
jgi:hypothetical protein